MKKAYQVNTKDSVKFNQKNSPMLASGARKLFATMLEHCCERYYTQKDPILDWENPFGDNFDTSHVYAPITGAMGYIGLRFGIE